jgi:adenylate cyclase
MVCNTTLEGPIGKLMSLAGIRRSTQNPNLCNRCGTHFQEGSVVELTVLFADLVGFTSMTNELGPEKTYDIVETFFEKANQALIKHDAFIDKYIGDAVMAIFNAPIQRVNHAGNALAAAHEIQKSLPDLSKQFGRDIQVRVGIASGYARVGRIGSKDRKDYTAVGDAVNLASRLQAFANPNEILIDGNGFDMISEDHPKVEAEYLNVKGFKEPVRAHRIQKAPNTLVQAHQPHGTETLDIKSTSSAGAILFAILGAPCAAASILGPLSIFLGAGALMGAATPFLGVLDKSFIRIPLQSLALIGALINLYVIWYGYNKRAKDGNSFALTRYEQRKTWLVGGMSALTLFAIGFEVYAHVYLEHMSLF